MIYRLFYFMYIYDLRHLRYILNTHEFYLTLISLVDLKHES